MLYVFCYQGDLFSEAPKPPIAEEKKPLNESLKTSIQAPGESDFKAMRKNVFISRQFRVSERKT